MRPNGPEQPCRPLNRRAFLTAAGAAGVAGWLTLGAGPAALADTFGPSTMYSPPSSAPSPKVLYPRVLQLVKSGSANGTMLATFEQYTNGTPVFPIFRSTDSGRTWSQYSTIRDTVNGWGLRYQPSLFELPVSIGAYPAGTIVAVGNSIPNDLSKTKLDVYVSKDSGATWSFVSTIATGGRAYPNNGETPVWEPFVNVYNGRLSVFYSDQRDPAYGQKIVHQTTTDLVTWGSVVNDVTTNNYDARPGMPIIAALPNGRWIMTYEYGGAPEANFAVYYRISTNPENWSGASAQVLRTADGVVPTSSPYVTWLPSGGPNGTIAVSANSDSSVYLNTSDGAANTWVRVPSQVAGGYSRALLPLTDGKTLFVLTAGYLNADNSVTYGAIDLGSAVSSGSTYKVVNRNSNLLLGVQSASTAAGAGLLQWSDNGTPDHLWKLERQSSGYWRIRNNNSNLVAGITNQSSDNGARALQWNDSGTYDHDWLVVPYPGGGFSIVNRASGKRLEIGAASTAVGAAVQQYQDTANLCQVWRLA